MGELSYGSYFELERKNSDSGADSWEKLEYISENNGFDIWAKIVQKEARS